MELTMALPCTQRRPASITDHFELSIMIGTRAISGSEASIFRKRTMAASESSMASSILISIICAPFSTCWRATARASSKRSSKISRANCFDPVTLVRSPTFTNRLSQVTFRGSKPDSRIAGVMSGTGRGARPLTASAIAAICSGVVPQQPPAILT